MRFLFSDNDDNDDNDGTIIVTVWDFSSFYVQVGVLSILYRVFA